MRQFLRHPTDILIYLSSSSAKVGVAAIEAKSLDDCAMTDVSVGGMACEVSKPLAVGQQVDICIPSVKPCYRGHGEVVWCQPCEQGFEVGVRFVDNEEAYKSRMVQQVCQIEYYKNIVFEREGRLIDSEQAALEWIEKYAADFPQ